MIRMMQYAIMAPLAQLLGGPSTQSLTDQDLGCRVVHPDGLEDGGTIIGHGHRALSTAAQQDLILHETAE